MYDLKNQTINICSLPDSFFSYQSHEIFDCSSTTKAHSFTPLMWISMHAQDPYFYNLLLASKHKQKFLESIDMQNSKGWTALHLAALNTNIKSHIDLVKIFVTKANLDVQTYNQWSALMMAAAYARVSSSNETVKLLLAHQALRNLTTRKGNTALMLAVNRSGTDSTKETVQILVLDKDVDINKRNDSWTNALGIAKSSSNADPAVISIMERAMKNAEIDENASLLH
jgi:ankyrin repeat protein